MTRAHGARAALVIAVLAATSATVAAADAPRGSRVVREASYVPKDPAAQRRIALEDAAVALINRAERRVRAKRPSCRGPVRPPAATFTDAAPSPELLGSIAALRRPPTALEETVAARLEGPRSFLPAQGLHRRYVRVLRAANGQSFSVITAQNSAFALKRPAGCTEANQAEVTRLVRGEPADVRAATLRISRSLRAQEKKADTGPREGIYLFALRGDGQPSGGGGGGGVASLRTHGSFSSSGGHRGSQLNGLLPDGVASITFEFPRVISLGRNFKPKTFKSAVTRTVRVQNNVVSFSVPRPPQFAFRSRMTWRDAGGNVIRIVRTP